MDRITEGALTALKGMSTMVRVPNRTIYRSKSLPGNGLQQAFESDPNILYISLHVHEDGRFYPVGDYGDHLHSGIGAGVGKFVIGSTCPAFKVLID